MSSYWTFQIVYSTAGPVKTCQTLRTITAGGGREQKINPVHYLQPTSYPVTSLRENIINLPTNNPRTPAPLSPLRQGKAPTHRQTKTYIYT